MPRYLDIPLVVIALLLLGTVIAFVLGFFVYPFGIFVLGFAFTARLLYLQQKK